MKIVKCEMPKQEFGDYDESEFSEYDVKDLSPEIDEIYYWYGEGNYCGSGNAIYKTKHDMWDSASLSHCSCYGPTDGLRTIVGAGYKTWEELVATFSSELKKECSTIIAALKERPTSSEGQ